jgi:hypothetical protein
MCLPKIKRGLAFVACAFVGPFFLPSTKANNNTAEAICTRATGGHWLVRR